MNNPYGFRTAVVAAEDRPIKGLKWELLSNGDFVVYSPRRREQVKLIQMLKEMVAKQELDNLKKSV